MGAIYSPWSAHCAFCFVIVPAGLSPDNSGTDCKSPDSGLAFPAARDVNIAGMNWHDECTKVHNEGLASLLRHGRIPFLLRPYDELGGHPLPDMISTDGIDDFMRWVLRTKAVAVFRRWELCAALMQSDTMQVDGHKFAQHFGLSRTLSPEEYQQEYLRILDKDFAGSVANMPRDLWQDAIATSIKGPKIPVIFLRTIYHKDTAGKVVLEDTERYSHGFMNIIPDWWEPVKN